MNLVFGDLFRPFRQRQAREKVSEHRFSVEELSRYCYVVGAVPFELIDFD